MNANTNTSTSTSTSTSATPAATAQVVFAMPVPPAGTIFQKSPGGNPWYHSHIDMRDSISIAAMNEQRADFSHLDGDLKEPKTGGTILISSLASEGWKSATIPPSVEPYNEAIHGDYKAHFQVQLDYLVSRSAKTAIGSEDAKAAQHSIEWFEKCHKTAPVLSDDGKTITTPGEWIRPTWAEVGGNSRWTAVGIANGYRLRDGLPLIETIPVFKFVENLSSIDRDMEQSLENGDDLGITKPTTKQRIRQLRGTLRKIKERDGKDAVPLSRAAYANLFRPKGVTSGPSDPMVNETRKVVVLDHLFEKLRIVDRIDAAGPVDNLPPITLNAHFGQTKMKGTNELLYRVVTDDRFIENAKRQTIATKSKKGEEYVPKTAARWGLSLKPKSLTNQTPYDVDKLFLEYDAATEAEVEAWIEGVPVKGADLQTTVMSAAASVAKLNDGVEADKRSKATETLASMISNIGTAGGAEALVQVGKTWTPVIDASEKLKGAYGGAQWLEMLSKIPEADHVSIMSVLSEPTMVSRLASLLTLSVTEWEFALRIGRGSEPCRKACSLVMDVHPKDLAKLLTHLEKLNATPAPAAHNP